MAGHHALNKAIFHSSQVEGRLLKQSLGLIRQAVAPKLGALQNCDSAGTADSINFTVSFSSVSSVAGFSGHANYSAANAAVDAFSGGRHSQGLPSTAIQWGAWASVGEPI
jgi:polyketide synthase 3/4